MGPWRVLPLPRILQLMKKGWMVPCRHLEDSVTGTARCEAAMPCMAVTPQAPRRESNI